MKLRPAVLFVAVLLLAPAALLLAPVLVGAEQARIVRSDSMAPALHAGDVAFLGFAAGIDAGDVVAFQPDGGGPMVLHRVIAVLEEGGGVAFRTKGDANQEPDPSLVRSDQVVGKLLWTLPFYGHAVSAARTPLGIAAILAISLLGAALEVRGLIARRGQAP